MKSPTRKHVFIIEDASEAANVRALLGQHSYEVSPLESAMESADGDAVYQIRHAIPRNPSIRNRSLAPVRI